jgi:hypothetical protein
LEFMVESPSDGLRIGVGGWRIHTDLKSLPGSPALTTVPIML